ncbi:MAG: hypothetical protein JW801_14875, partial [Bacteroidales bacterium]|nr:hypothetical protein [Bacteroidales bacterium]
AINTTLTNGIDIGCDDGNINVTGGTIEVMLPTEDAAAEPEFEINTTAPFWNLTLTESANGGTQQLALQSSLTILNDLTIGANTELETKGYDLSIGGDLIIEDGGVFDHDNNTTYFIGDQNSSIQIENSGTANYLQFYNLVIGKDAGSPYYDVSIAECPGRTETASNAANSIIQVQNDLTITEGQFTIERYTLSLTGDLTITDGQLVYNPSLSGRLRMNGGSAQTITGSALYTPNFGYIELNNSFGATITTDVELDFLTMTNGIINIGINELAVDTNFIDGSGFGATKMIEADADHGAKGLKLKMDGNYSSGGTVAFPVGSNGYWGNVNVNMAASVGSIAGYLTVATVNLYHPTRPVGGCDAIDGYWKTTSSGLSGTTSGVEFEITSTYAGFGGGARAYYMIDGIWDESGGVTTPGTLTYDAGDLDGFHEQVDFTVGKNACFNNVDIIYSATTGNWNVGSTWVGGSVPATYDYAVIRDGHTVSLTRNNSDDAGKLIVEAGGTLNIGTYTGLSYNIVEGAGTIRIASNTIPTADYDEFMYNDTATFEYYGNGYTLPTTFSVYPNLKISGTAAKTMPNQDVLVRRNLYIDGETLRLNEADDLVVNDSIIFDNAGILQFPNGTNPCVVTVNKSVDMTGSSSANSMEVATGGAYSNHHSLYVYQDILVTSGSSITFFRNSGDKAVDLYFLGNGNSEVNDDGVASSNTIDLNRLIINKTLSTADVNFQEEFTLNGPTNGDSDDKALYLISGDLLIDNSGTDIYLTSGGQDFVIPSAASLQVSEATVRASGTNTGIYLDGLMKVDLNSQWLLNEGTNNYIEYTASENAEIDIQAGTLRVGSQIRRSTLTNEGILNFSQNNSGSTVIIGETDAPTTNRGVFEILNSGSSFTQVGDARITIVRAQSTLNAPSIFLDPETLNLGSGSGFIIGNGNTPASEIISIYSTPALQNIRVDGTNNPTLLLSTVPLTLNEDLIIEPGATVDANGWDLIMKGDFLNSGTFTHNNNTTFFSGTGNQRLLGNTTFYNLIKTTSSELHLAASAAAIAVEHDMDFQDGILRDSSNTVSLLGDCNFDATHIHGSQAGEGIYFNGSFAQELTGVATFGKLTTNNSEGIYIPLGYNVTVTDTLKLMDGVFSIGKNLLTLPLGAVIEEDSPFSSSNMIQTNVSFTDYGVRKYLPAGASSFVYPIGSGGKYTPVTLNITGNGNSTGSITVKAADEMHPSIQEDSEAPDPEITDEDNVLQYHWLMRSNGMSGFQATVTMKYAPPDVAVTAPYDIYDYITARLLNDGSGLWNKYDDVDKFDETSEILIFDFGGVGDDEISGDYTAGVDGSSFNGAIPDLVPTYETNNSGNWSTGTIWTPNVTGGPRGAITTINSGHTVTLATNYISSYTTEILGEVQIYTTIGHRFGEVTGNGTLYTEREVIPAGIYDQFFSSAGGTLEYGGSADLDVLAGQALINNLTFSGTAGRRLPGNDITLNGDLLIDGGATLTVINDNNIDLYILGDLALSGGNYDAGSDLSSTISFVASVNQTISGNFTGTNTLNTLEIDNPNGVSLTGNVDVASELVLTDGIITTNGNDLTIALTATISPSGGTSTQHVDGALTKVLNSSGDFSYPVGDNGGAGLIDLIDVNGWGGGTAGFSAEYFNSNPTTDIGSAMETGVNTLSNTEYWEIQSPAGGQGLLKITLDGSSDVANALTDLSDLAILGWDGSEWDIVGTSFSIAGISTSGSITCTADIDFDAYSYFTLGSTETITLITASVTSGDAEVCAGESATITIALTGGTPPWEVQYSDGTTTYTESNILTSPHTITVTPAATTSYTLTSVRDDTPLGGSIVGDPDAVITVNALPTVTLTNNSSGDELCDGDEIIFTAGGGSNYDFYLNGGSDQTGTLSTYTRSTIVDQDEIYVIATDNNGCSNTSSTTTITVYAPPTADAGTDEETCEGIAFDLSTGTTPPTASNYLSLSWGTSGDGSFDDNTALQPSYTPGSNDATAGSATLTLTANGNNGCSSVSDPMSLTVTPENTAGLASATPTLCINSPLTAITHATTGATGISDDGDDTGVNGLPTGVSATWAADVITISGTPTASGTFNYSIPLTGGCGTVNATGTILVNPSPAPSISGTTLVCEGSAYAFSTAASGNSFAWTVTGGTIDSGQGTEEITVTWDMLLPVGTLNGPGTVEVVETISATGCTASDNYAVSVYRKPVTGPVYHIDSSVGN